MAQVLIPEMINALYSLFGLELGSYHKSSGEAKPDVIKDDKDVEKISPKSCHIPLKFREDIAALEREFGGGFVSGLCIEWSLQEALLVLPRERKRVDAYRSLSEFLLDKMGITLSIKSQKSKLL